MPVSKILISAFSLTLVVLISTPFIVLLLAVQTRPAVENIGPLSAGELTKIEQLLLDSAPASTATTSRQQLSLAPEDLNLLLRYGLQVMNLTPDWTGTLALEANNLVVTLSIAIGGSGVPLYLNVAGELAKQDGSLHLIRLRTGNLSLPQSVREYAVARLVDNLLSTNLGFQDFVALSNNIEQLDIGPEILNLQMRWEPALIDRIASRTRQIFVPETDRRRILAYYEQIREIVATIPTDLRAVSLNSFMVPLFNHARELSQQGNDPVIENQAALQALAIYVNNESLQTLLGPDTANIDPVKFIEVRLQRRQDLARHLTSSAATTSSAGVGFARMLSTTKEAYDARYRSGFSFSDLTANIVGMTIATLAIRDRNSALLMQSRLSTIETEDDYMPVAGNNQDGMSEADFNSLYRNRNSVIYEQRIADIESLIMARPLFQGFD